MKFWYLELLCCWLLTSCPNVATPELGYPLIERFPLDYLDPNFELTLLFSNSEALVLEPLTFAAELEDNRILLDGNSTPELDPFSKYAVALDL